MAVFLHFDIAITGQKTIPERSSQKNVKAYITKIEDNLRVSQKRNG